MSRLLLLALVALWPLSGYAHQVHLHHLERVPRLQLDADKVNAEIQRHHQEAQRFAVPQTLSAGVADGEWEDAADGSSVWRLRVSSPGAASLSVELRELQLPADAELWISTADGQDAQGPYTAADGPSLLTALVRSDEAVIEASMPTAEREQFQLQLAQVFHAYRTLDGAYMPKGYFGTSGACTVDAVCSDGDNWRDEIRSTVMVTIANTSQCTGTLVNNTAQDDRALILTANHCGITSSNVTQTKAYFNVQKSSCGGSGNGSVTQNISGRQLLAATSGTSNSDYSLFELASVPPPSYNVHYAGWDVSGGIPSSGVGISHPAGDDKKISTYSNPASLQSNICVGSLGAGSICVGFTIKALAINWSRGATQPGSSGSGLWNQNHRIVGTLSGGTSGCLSSNPVQANGGTDMYARLDIAWNAGSVTGTPLKSVLDPLGSTCTGIDGKEPGSSAAAGCAGGSSGGGSSGSSGGTPVTDSSGGGGGGGALQTLDLLVLLSLLLLLRLTPRSGKA